VGINQMGSTRKSDRKIIDFVVMRVCVMRGMCVPGWFLLGVYFFRKLVIVLFFFGVSKHLPNAG
jgi:hypothetical protein